MKKSPLKYQKVFALSALFFILMAASSLLDIHHDKQDALSDTHIRLEFITLFISISAAAFFIYDALRLYRENRRLNEDIQKQSLEHEQYRNKLTRYSQGVFDLICEEFQKWELTKTETEIGFLILKGLSTKEIAKIQNSQDKTVRQHCSSIYRKSGLAGRSELSAYFLEDLLSDQSHKLL